MGLSGFFLATMKTEYLIMLKTFRASLLRKQQQKLAIARAIYRSSPLIILDEPTAALDPLAEAEVYDKFNSSIIKDKTAIYISHRLSSCKFCDVVFYIEDGGIKEQGSHDELMALRGQYANMFRLQQEQFAR